MSIILYHSKTTLDGRDSKCDGHINGLNHEEINCHDTIGGNPEESQYLNLVSGILLHGARTNYIALNLANSKLSRTTHFFFPNFIFIVLAS